MWHFPVHILRQKVTGIKNLFGGCPSRFFRIHFCMGEGGGLLLKLRLFCLDIRATLFKICSLSLVKISLSVKMLASSHKQWFALVTWSWRAEVWEGGSTLSKKIRKKAPLLWIASRSVEQEAGEALDKLDHLPGHRRATNFVFPGSTSLITNCRHQQLYGIR